jgi:hypothetical protein
VDWLHFNQLEWGIEKQMIDKDIFEILGINSREDSYTDLLGYAFSKSAQFKSNFCLEFAGYVSDDFSLKIRNAHDYINLSSKRKEVPDMILISKLHNEIILIENKIFSVEGDMQTIRYSEKSFVEAVKNRLKMSSAKFDKFYYLTLDGSQSVSGNFISKRWSSVILNCTRNVEFEDQRLKILMNDLATRVNHYEQSKNSDLNISFLEYFKYCEKWVSPVKAFRNMSIETFDKIEKNYPVKVHFSDNTSNGRQLLILFNNESWNLLNINAILKEIPAANDLELIEFAKCRNIHIEVNWSENSKRITQFIHYETNPYISYKKLDAISPKFALAFNKNKDRFRDEILKNIPNGWKKNSKSKYIAPIKTHYILSDSTKCLDVINWIESNFRIAYECIVNTLIAIDSD